jgi:hypothetical protein
VTHPTVELRYKRGEAGAAEIQAAVNDVLDELADPDSEAVRATRAAGLDPAELTGSAVQVREGKQGAEPILTSIVVGIAVKIGASAAEALWRKVIWPSLRRRLGARVLGEPLPESLSDNAAGSGAREASGS